MKTLFLATFAVFLLVSSLFCLWYTDQLAGRINVALQYILDTKKDLKDVSETVLVNEMILKATTEDYPKKMNLSERSWCPNRECVEGTYAY